MKHLNVLKFLLVIAVLLTGKFVSAQCLSTAAHRPSTAASVPFSGSSFSFANPLHITNSSSDYTSASALVTLLSGSSERLQAKGFGFAIPSYATICGVEVRIHRAAEGIGLFAFVHDARVQLLKNGIMVGSNEAKSDLWSNQDVKVYGGPSSSWNTTWTPAEVNSPDFGVSVTAQITGLLSLLPSAKVYGIEMIVNYNLALPVRLTEFSLKSSGDQVSLLWKVADQENNTRYIVQRSSDGTNWKSISNTQYRGRTLATATHTYVDASPPAGNFYYRIKIIEREELVTFSKTLRVASDAQSNPLSVFPNPAVDIISISGAENSELLIYNANGVVVHRQNTGTANSIQVDISQLPSGVYVVKAGMRSSRLIKK